MLFTSATFLALLSAVLADQTFTLTASGGVEGPVTFGNNALTIGNGDAPTLVLEEPSGYVNIQGTSNYLQLSPDGVIASAQSDASRNFQILNGVTFAAGPSEDNAQWFACSADVGYIIKSFQSAGCEPVTLNVVGAEEQPAEEPETTEPAEEPETTEPAEEPETTEPAEEPETTEPTEEPETTEPAEEPETTEPAEEPETTEPAAEEPETTEPAAEEPETTEPAAEEPETTEAAEEPAATEPAAEEPVESPEPTVAPAEGAGVKLSTGAGAVVAAAIALFM